MRSEAIKRPEYIVIDTETNGLPRYKDAEGKPIPADADGQPRMAELAIVYLDQDFNIQRESALYVRPDGWEMTEEATAKNGLTTEYLNEHGRPIVEVLNDYQNAIEDGRHVLAYGAQFDCKMCRGELRRAGLDDLFEKTFNACIMQSCSPLKMPKANGKGGWPSLADACAFFGIENPNPHTGRSDARAAAEIAKILHERGLLKPCIVHHAKNHPSREEK